MFGIDIDMADPFIFAAGIAFGVAAVTVFRQYSEKITKTMHNSFVGTRYGRRLGLKRI